MSIEAELKEVTTGDSSPHVAPYKVSAKATKNSLTFVWKIIAGSTIRAWRVRINPLNRNSGQLHSKQGMVCGSGDRCGPNTRSLALTSPVELTTVVAESEVASEPDGEIPVGFWGMAESDGWSS
jgi:hypothetical protein